MKKTGFSTSIALLLLFANINVMAQRKSHPVGMIKVTTEMSGMLVVDTLPAQNMTIYHHVLVSGIDTGRHTLFFKHDSLTVQKKILVRQGQTDQYVVKPDSIVHNLSVKGRYLKGYSPSIRSYYIPKTKGLYCLASVGFSSGKGYSYFNGMIVAGYQVSPLFSVGAGTGYLRIYSSFDQFIFLLLATSSTENSTGFSVPFIPVFVDVRLNLIKKRVTPYFSFDIGCSFPVNKEIDGEYTEVDNLLGYETTDHYRFHIDKINPGFYLAINPGLKIFVYDKYFLDLSLGWDICFNKFTGNRSNLSYPSNPFESINEVRSLSCFHMNVGFGF
jgi:hypothetical protein